MLRLSYNPMLEIPENKKQFLNTPEPITLFAFVDMVKGTASYALTHPKDELATQHAGLLKNPENIYLYIRNQAARDYIGEYGTNLIGDREVRVSI